MTARRRLRPLGTTLKALAAICVIIASSIVLYSAYSFSVAVNANPLLSGAHYPASSWVIFVLAGLVGLIAAVYLLKLIFRR